MAGIPNEVMARLRKVANLTASTNVNEAAVASRKLQEMLRKYQLSMADISMSSVGEVVEERKIETGRKVFRREERALLGAIVAGMGGGLILCHSAKGAYFKVIAHRTDGEFIEWLYGLLLELVSREVDEKLKRLRGPKQLLNQFRSNFFDGAAAVIFKRLNEKPETEDHDCRALVALKSADVEKHLMECHGDIPQARRPPKPKHFAGIREGVAFGNSVPLDRPIQDTRQGLLLGVDS